MSSTASIAQTEVRAEVDQKMRLRIADCLQGKFKGDVIGPEHPDYPKRRAVWNSMVDKKPGLILRCTSVADVVAAVDAARANALRPSIRCGGHNVAGKALSDGGLTLDMSGMREVTVDARPGKLHGHTIDADLASVLNSVAVQIVPDAIAERPGAAEAKVNVGAIRPRRRSDQCRAIRSDDAAVEIIGRHRQAGWEITDRRLVGAGR